MQGNWQGYDRKDVILQIFIHVQPTLETVHNEQLICLQATGQAPLASVSSCCTQDCSQSWLSVQHYRFYKTQHWRHNYCYSDPDCFDLLWPINRNVVLHYMKITYYIHNTYILQQLGSTLSIIFAWLMEGGYWRMQNTLIC